MKALVTAAALMMFVPLAPAAAQGGSLADKLINSPGAVRVDGAKARIVKDAKVQGGSALRVPAKKGVNPWDIAVTSDVIKPIKAGDNLIVAFWARLQKGEKGAKSVSLPYNALQLSAAPYNTLFSQPVTIVPEWTMFEVKGKADKDYAAGTVKATFQVATADQTVDFGPVFVLNLGR